MTTSKTIRLLRKKFLKIFGFLILIRLGLYIPVPGVDLDIFAQTQSANSFPGLIKNFIGSSFFGIGSLGITPYINASIVIQLLTPIIPSLERLQKEEGELGRKQIKRYTRYLALGLALVQSTGIAIFLVKPIVFNWNIELFLKITLSLTTGSMITAWLGELITKEELGNGSSMILFMNIASGLPSNLTQFSFDNLSSIKNLSALFISYLVYFGIVILVVLVQYSYKRVEIVSAKQLNFNSLEQSFVSSKLKNGYIPLKLNQGGIMPLVFSSTIATLILVPLQVIFPNVNLLTLFNFVLNLILVVFFSAFYALLVLNPKDLSTNLTKMSYNVPGLKQGKATTRYLEQVIVRLALLGGIFLAFLTFFPLIVGNVFKFNLFKNLTSLIFLIGVITDVTSQVKGYLISRNYEGLKNP